ncbi:MAG: large conductance mechanosensitive channel protein MscL [Christensenellales bacterium]|nr:large conductance mechanosensitive channel protein MscL [Clostridia bacterium]
MEKKKNGLKGFFGEFKQFITRGNVMDMAVGVIVGGAFTAIITALSDHILKPLINWLLALILGKNSLSEVYTFLKPAYVDGQIDLANSIYIDWGAFINAIINFLIIAFVLFCIVKAINSFAQAREKFVEGMELSEKKAISKYRREGMTKAQAKARYAEDVAKAQAAKEEEERLAKQKEDEEKAEAEAKASANTRLLEEIRDSLKELAAKR